MTSELILRQALQSNDVEYPCYMVVYGPERTHRTQYRGENGSAFASGIIWNVDDAIKLVAKADYQGHFTELTIRTVGVAPFMTSGHEEKVIQR